VAETAEFLTIRQLQTRLRISRSTAVRLLKAGRFHGAFRISRDWRIPRAAVDAFIKAQQEAAAVA
jgi:excisionase family DNA binding protein